MSKIKRKVLLDIDGCVLDMLSALEECVTGFDKTKVQSYYFDGDIGCLKSDIYTALNSVSVFKAQKYYNGAYDAVQRLKEFADVEAYTSVPQNLFILHHRQKQIDELGISGKPYLSEPKPVISGVDAVFEDNLSQLHLWLGEKSTKLYLINHDEYNRVELMTDGDWGRVIRCADLADAVDKYLKTL